VEVRGLADRHLRLPDAPLDPANRRISILLRYTQLPTPDEVLVPGGPAAAGAELPASRVQRSTGEVTPHADN
jgi:hypothetical protein